MTAYAYEMKFTNGRRKEYGKNIRLKSATYTFPSLPYLDYRIADASYKALITANCVSTETKLQLCKGILLLHH